MTRIRSIHPGFFGSQICTLPAAARLLFIGLWTMADDNGVFLWEPWKLKAELFPVDSSVEEIERFLNDLMRLGLIQRFPAGTKIYGAIRNFAKYQRPQKPRPIYPCPPMLFEFLGFHPDGSRPREMAKTLASKMNHESLTTPIPVSSQSYKTLPDNWKEKQIPTREKLGYQDRAVHEDLGWDANLS